MQGGKILACAACEDSQSVASASSNGTVHVWRVEYTSRSGGAPDRYTGIIGRSLFLAGSPCLRWCSSPSMRAHLSMPLKESTREP